MDRTVMLHLEATEWALRRGDVATALDCLSRTRRWLLEGGTGAPIELVSPRGCLTEREAATLRLLPDASLSQKDIARALGVTRNTVKSHLKSVYQKLGVHSRGEAIEAARHLGIIGTWHVEPRRTSTVGDACDRVLAS